MSPPEEVFRLPENVSTALQRDPDGEGFLNLEDESEQRDAIDQIMMTIDFASELEGLVPVEKR